MQFLSTHGSHKPAVGRTGMMAWLEPAVRWAPSSESMLALRPRAAGEESRSLLPFLRLFLPCGLKMSLGSRCAAEPRAMQDH